MDCNAAVFLGAGEDPAKAACYIHVADVRNALAAIFDFVAEKDWGRAASIGIDRLGRKHEVE